MQQGAEEFWNKQATGGFVLIKGAQCRELQCPGEGCENPKFLAELTSGPHTKNAGKRFVSCNRDYGGCGLFCFTDQLPKNSGQGAPKRAKTLHVPAAAPGETDSRLAELAAKVDRMAADIVVLTSAINQMAGDFRAGIDKMLE